MENKYKDWQSSQWGEWLSMRDVVISQYFDTLRKYINLPAFDHLVMRDLKKNLDPRILKLTYTVVAPPENAILHNWQEDVPRTLEIPEDMDAGDEEEYPELETPVEQIPDDERIYQLLDLLRQFSLLHRDLMEEWTALMPELLKTESAQLAVTGLMLFSQCLLCIQVCRDAICAWERSKAIALLKHGTEKYHSFARILHQRELKGSITPRVFQLVDAMTALLDKTALLLANLPQSNG